MFEKSELDVKDINQSIMDELVDVVLPDGETILSRLIAVSCNETHQFEDLMEVFMQRKTQQNPLCLHMIPNIEGKTVLHKAVELQSARAVESLLALIGDYPLDDHIAFITDIIPQMMNLSPVAVAKYFERRVLNLPWGLT